MSPLQQCADALSQRQPSEHCLTTWDGVRLFYRAWLPPLPAQRALILIHRGHEHSGRFQGVVDALALGDVAVFAWDARGHGRSPGERGYAETFSCLVKDLDTFVRLVVKTHTIPVENVVVLGHSVGAVIVAAWAHDYAPPIRAMILACPALRVKLYVPFALPLLRLLQTNKRKAFIQSYVKSRMLTHDPEQAARYRTDPLITRAIAVNVLIGLYDTSTRLLKDAGAIHVPTLVLSAGADSVVRRAPQQQFFEGLSSPFKAMHTYSGMYHDIFHEKDRHLPIARVREFIVQVFQRPPAQPSLLDADQKGFTRTEYERLSRPLPLLCPRRLWFALLRVLMQSLGRFSRGIRLGWRSGFDSGESLDYVYQDTPQGTFPLGRWIDRQYLSSVGWKGIRQRKANLKAALRKTIDDLSPRSPVRLVDIASGLGRYVLETMKEARCNDMSALLRDRDSASLEAGRRLARQLRISNVTFEHGDAFDPQSLRSILPRPNIAIASGLYELFPDNQLVLTSLLGLNDALLDGGFLIYTNQPWHPQVEMIARVLPNREGHPWVMRRRSQAEMDALVHTAGFRKVSMEVDEAGIFTVSVARKG